MCIQMLKKKKNKYTNSIRCVCIYVKVLQHHCKYIAIYILQRLAEEMVFMLVSYMAFKKYVYNHTKCISRSTQVCT